METMQGSDEWLLRAADPDIDTETPPDWPRSGTLESTMSPERQIIEGTRPSKEWVR